MKYLLRVLEPLDKATSSRIVDKIEGNLNPHIFMEEGFTSNAGGKGMSYRLNVIGNDILFDGFASQNFYESDQDGICLCKEYCENQITVDDFFRMFCGKSTETFEDELMRLIGGTI